MLLRLWHSHCLKKEKMVKFEQQTKTLLLAKRAGALERNSNALWALFHIS